MPCCLHVATELRIADLLQGGPRRIASIIGPQKAKVAATKEMLVII
jgi:hypothetical protein